MKAASLPLRASSRFGPIVPSAPASESVWQELQAGAAPLVKIVLPSGAAPPPAWPPAAWPPPLALAFFACIQRSNC